MNDPQVSVVVIALNEAKSAPTCIQSILAQDAEVSFEAILVDDGSTDDTAGLVKSAFGNDPRIRIVRLPENRGRGAARRAGLEATEAPLVAYVDADITLPADWLRRCLAALPGHAAVGGIAVPDGDVAVIARLSRATPRVVPPLMPVVGSNSLFRADVLRRSGFDPNDRLGEDFRLAGRLLKEGETLYRVPGLIVRHEETRSFGRAVRWRFENGLDAGGHIRDLGRLRQADLAWIATLGASVGGAALAALSSPWFLLLGPVVVVGAALAHVGSRFEPRGLGPFLVAWTLNVPMMAAYVLGRTIALIR